MKGPGEKRFCKCCGGRDHRENLPPVRPQMLRKWPKDSKSGCGLSCSVAHYRPYQRQNNDSISADDETRTQRTHSVQSRALTRKQVERSILLQVRLIGLEKVGQDNSRPSQRPARHEPERERREIGFLRCRRTASLPAGGQRQRRGAGGLI